MKLYVETIQAHKPYARRSSDGDIHMGLTGNGTFVAMTRQEAVELAAQLMRAANAGTDQREVA